MPKSPLPSVGMGHIKALTLVGRYGYLTSEQATRAPGGWAKGSKTLARKVLHETVQLGFCARRLVGRSTPGGSLSLYCLTSKGARVLADHDIETSVQYEAGELAVLSPLYLEHSRAVVDVLLLADWLPRVTPKIRIERLENERDCRRRPGRVDLDGKSHRLSLDAFIALGRLTPDGRWPQVPVLLELDRGTERRVKWTAKVRALTEWITSDDYKKRYSTGALITVVAVTGPAHAETLKSWTEASLTALGRTDLAANFRFTGQRADQTSAEQFFLAPTWLVPFGAPAPIIEGVL
jgi:hypothetical protein